MPEMKLIETETRANPAVTQIAIPSPAVAGKPFAAPRLWHSAHANNLRRMMARAGYEEVKYKEASDDGRGAVIYFANYSVDAVPGVIPEPVQAYLNEHLGNRFLETLQAFVKTTMGVLDVLDDVFPAVAVVTAPAILALDAADDLLDRIEEDNGDSQ